MRGSVTMHTNLGLWTPDTPYESREYQEFGTQFLKLVRRGFLTDAPGLGKTPTAIKATELPCMVVAPRYLCEQWEDAIRREHGDAVIANADGTRKKREEILGTRADWYILNREMLPIYDLPSEIRTYINDESHHFRNRKATVSQAAAIIENRDSKARIYNLTATPFWKTPDDIWMQCHILYPDIFTSYHKFIQLYCQVIKSPWGGPKVVGVKAAMKQGLKELLKPMMLGRTYEDVGRYLPEIVESTVKIRMSPVLEQLYNKLMFEFRLRWDAGESEQKTLLFQPMTVLHPIRQITAQAGKFDAVLGIIEDNNDKPAVIGFWYKDHAKMMYEKIGANKAELITGDLDAQERVRRAMKAQAQGRHIVATQRSLREGVNLYQYRLFIFGEEDYVPGSNHQFLSRVVRDRNDGGKDREPVRVFYVQARQTIDEIIHRVSKTRKRANEAVRVLLELSYKSVA